MKKKWFWLVLFILGIDQASKLVAVKYFTNTNSIIKITNFLNINLVYNRGISFGMFSQLAYSNYLFSFISIIIVCFLLKWLKNSDILSEQISICLIIAGAIGNIIDRLNYQAVVDFIQLHWNGFFWPSFNIADSAICLGVFILIFYNNKTKLNDETKNEKI